jgi:hypothetical protein
MRRAQDLLGIIGRRFSQIEHVFQGMARVKLREAQLDRYLRDVFPDPRDPANERAIAKSTHARAWSRYFFHHGKGNVNPAVAETLWAAYNGVTEFVDHCVPKRMGSGEKPITQVAMTRRLESVWFGDGYSIKARAFEVASRQVESAS